MTQPPFMWTPQDLAERLRSATGPDREIDAAVWRSLEDPGEVGMPKYTRSLDEALALVERSGWRLYTLDLSVAGLASATLKGPVRHYPADAESHAHDGPAWAVGMAKTPALAVISALLKGLNRDA